MEKSNEENEEEVWINCKAYRVDGVLNHLVSGAPIYIYLRIFNNISSLHNFTMFKVPVFLIEL